MGGSPPFWKSVFRTTNAPDWRKHVYNFQLYPKILQSSFDNSSQIHENTLLETSCIMKVDSSQNRPLCKHNSPWDLRLSMQGKLITARCQRFGWTQYLHLQGRNIFMWLFIFTTMCSNTCQKTVTPRNTILRPFKLNLLAAITSCLKEYSYCPISISL